MKKIKISEIKICDEFVEHQPSERKIVNKMKWIKKRNRQHGNFCKIVLDENGVLIDGYATMLAMEKMGYTECYCSIKKPNYREQPTTYIFGYHPNSVSENREYVWRVPNAQTEWIYGQVLPGDTVLCQTKFGIAPVVVTRIETLDKCPVEMRVKKFIAKLITSDVAREIE